MTTPQEAARSTPHESKTRPMPEPNLCSECGLSPWADIHLTAKQARTAKARQARRRNVLKRKADEYAAALRELGYTVTAPDENREIETVWCDLHAVGAHFIGPDCVNPHNTTPAMRARMNRARRDGVL